MSCGTPTLTYNYQGPSESIVDGHTGWLVENDKEIVEKATILWKQGYPQEMRKNCVKEAFRFDKTNYVAKWLELLEKSCDIEIGLRPRMTPAV